MILLVHETATHGMVATPERVRGVHHPSRRYHHEGHFLAVDGDDPHVLEHDAEEILKIPGFRLATAAEQDAYHAAKRKKHQVVEEVKPPAEEGDGEPAPEQVETPPEEKKPRGQRRKE